MDNGHIKIRTGHFKPSAEQLAVFKKYNQQGVSNEMIALLTGYRKRTVDKYVTENVYVTNAWNNIKTYANEQVAIAVKAANEADNDKIDQRIAVLRKELEELEAKKTATNVVPFNWYVKFEGPKMIAKADGYHNDGQNYVKYRAAFSALSTLMQDKKTHTTKEVDDILRSIGYSATHNRRRILKHIFGDNITLNRGKYTLN